MGLKDGLWSESTPGTLPNNIYVKMHQHLKSQPGNRAMPRTLIVNLNQVEVDKPATFSSHCRSPSSENLAKSKESNVVTLAVRSKNRIKVKCRWTSKPIKGKFSSMVLGWLEWFGHAQWQWHPAVFITESWIHNERHIVHCDFAMCRPYSCKVVRSMRMNCTEVIAELL